MPDPQTVNILLSVPTRGSNVGVWDTPVNADFSSIDGHLGGVQSVSLSASNVTLTSPTGTATPSGGPTQAENMAIKLSGTLSANIVLTFPLPGEYIVRNNCTVGAFYVQARALGTGNMVGIPDGRSVKIWNDGVDVDFCDMPEVGSALDLHTNTTTLPRWMTACSVLPYLIKNGGIHTASLYPVLATRLGSTYGGNGATTFGVPDELSRIRLPVDSSGSAARVTQAISGINGTTFGSAGGDQSVTLVAAQIPALTGTTSLNFNAHSRSIDSATGGVVVLSGSASATNPDSNYFKSGENFGGTTAPTLTIGTNNGTAFVNKMLPAIVDFLPLIKT